MRKIKYLAMAFALIFIVLTVSGCACEHEYGEWTTVTEATCAADGIQQRSCAKCDGVEERVIAMLLHTYGEWTTAQESTCTVAGKEERTCSGCGAAEERSAALKEHSYGSWKITQAPTCVKTGMQISTCSVCGAAEEKTVDMVEHSYGKWATTKAATCTENGSKTRTCSSCGKTETETIAAGHKWKEATCTEAKSCSVCGATDGVAVGHKWKEATCTSAKKCTACGAQEGKKLGHSTGSDGKCTRCGEVNFSYYVAPTKQEYVSGNYRSMPVVEINSVGGIKVKWEAKYLGEKTISYYTVYMTLMDPFGTPIKDEISGKSQISCRVLGPVKKNENLLLYNVVGYNGNCNVVKITKIKLEFTDGTSVEGDYSFLIRSFNPRYDGF